VQAGPCNTEPAPQRPATTLVEEEDRQVQRHDRDEGGIRLEHRRATIKEEAARSLVSSRPVPSRPVPS
jgi:hypothetical protein